MNKVSWMNKLHSIFVLFFGYIFSVLLANQSFMLDFLLLLNVVTIEINNQHKAKLVLWGLNRKMWGKYFDSEGERFVFLHS